MMMMNTTTTTTNNNNNNHNNNTSNNNTNITIIINTLRGLGEFCLSAQQASVQACMHTEHHKHVLLFVILLACWCM